MIVWRGKGLLVLLVGFVCSWLIEWLADSVFGIPEGRQHYREAHSWVWLLSMGSSAVACWFVGQQLEAHELKTAKVVIDKETGQDIRLVGRNDMFWIPVKWWAVVYLAIGVWLAIGK